jgi:antitoxin PrlF
VTCAAGAAAARFRASKPLRSLDLAEIAVERGLAHYRGYYDPMKIASSKLTAQGQISVPAEVRRRLGVGPGSILEWEQQGDKVVVQRAGRYSSEEVHQALFPEAPEPRTLADLEEGIRRHVRNRHARR